VSKEKLDFRLQLGEKVVEETVVENTTRAIVNFLKGVLKYISYRLIFLGYKGTDFV
jgi:hypothetical protein